MSNNNSNKVQCVADGDAVPLWECPCHVCTRLDWEASDEPETVTVHDWRRLWFPEVYAPDEGGRAMPRFGLSDASLVRLERSGYDSNWLQHHRAGWAQ